MNDAAASQKLKSMLVTELEQRLPDDLEVARFELENEWHHHFECGDPDLIDGLLEDKALLSRFVDAFIENVDHLSKASSISLDIERMLTGLMVTMGEA